MANQKYTDILEKVQEDIRSGRYIPGQRLPSETELVRRYGASRMTVFRAMHELQNMGLVVRRVGSGTFVAQSSKSKSHVFGLLIPELGQTEIFESICKGMMESHEAVRHSLLWETQHPKKTRKKKSQSSFASTTSPKKCRGYFLLRWSSRLDGLGQITKL